MRCCKRRSQRHDCHLQVLRISNPKSCPHPKLPLPFLKLQRISAFNDERKAACYMRVMCVHSCLFSAACLSSKPLPFSPLSPASQSSDAAVTRVDDSCALDLIDSLPYPSCFFPAAILCSARVAFGFSNGAIDIICNNDALEISCHTGCICIIDCSACSVLQRVTVHNKDISSICCVSASCNDSVNASGDIVMASACKAGVVVVTVLGGSSCSLNTFKPKVHPSQMNTFRYLFCVPFLLTACFNQGGGNGDQHKPWAAVALVMCPAPDRHLLLLYGGGAGELFCCRVQLYSSTIDLKPSLSSVIELRDRGHSRTIFAIRSRATIDDVQVVGAIQF